MSATEMDRFWDERAREDAYYFVFNQLRYGDPDADRFWESGEQTVAKLLDAVGVSISPTDTVLDIGCGVGRLTRAIAARAAEVVAIDVSEEMLKRAREQNGHLENVRWIKGDGQTLAPVQDASVDACVSYVVFQHIPDPQIALGYVREMGRVLRPGGWGAFQISTDPHIHQRRRGRNALSIRLNALLRRGPRGQFDPRWLGSSTTEQDLRRAADDGNMDLERLVNPDSQFSLVLVRRRA